MRWTSFEPQVAEREPLHVRGFGSMGFFVDMDFAGHDASPQEGLGSVAPKLTATAFFNKDIRSHQIYNQASKYLLDWRLKWALCEGKGSELIVQQLRSAHVAYL